MKLVKSISLKTLGTLALPLVMFLAMVIATASVGKVGLYVNAESMEEILRKSCMASLIAMGLSVQILNGRFDFTGGINIILSAYLAGHIAQAVGGAGSIPLYIVLCVVFGILISMLTAFMYKILRMPIIITSIALTLVYESVPRVLFDGKGTQLFSDNYLKVLGFTPWVFLILLVGVLLYFYFKDLSVGGTRARLLANNQMTAVNIGINETKNLYYTYLFSGALFGLAGIIYGATTWIQPGEIGNLSTTSVAFSNIVPVYIGMFIGFLSYGWVGVLVGAVSIQMLNKGLAVMINGDVSGYYSMFFGVFMMLFWTLSAELNNIKKLFAAIQMKIALRKSNLHAPEDPA